MSQTYPSTLDKTRRLEECNGIFALSKTSPSDRRLVLMLVETLRRWELDKVVVGVQVPCFLLFIPLSHIALHSTSTSMSVANVKLTELQRLHAFLQMILLHMRFNIDSDRSRRTLQICWLLQMQMDLARPSYVVSFCSATLFFATFEHNETALLL
jgi:hypothetical protein